MESRQKQQKSIDVKGVQVIPPSQDLAMKMPHTEKITSITAWLHVLGSSALHKYGIVSAFSYASCRCPLPLK